VGLTALALTARLSTGLEASGTMWQRESSSERLASKKARKAGAGITEQELLNRKGFLECGDGDIDNLAAIGKASPGLRGPQWLP